MLKVYAFSTKLQVVNAAASFVNHRTRKTVLLSICNQSFVFGANHFTLELGSDYMYPFSFENITFLLRIPAIVHTCTMKTITENATFRKCTPEWNFLKTPFNSFRVNRQKRSFSKTLTSHYHFQAKRYEYDTVWTRIFLKTELKVAFSNENGYVWSGPYNCKSPCFPRYFHGLGRQ